MSRKQPIPDLRNTPEITLEHCSVLMSRIETAIHIITDGVGSDGFVDEIGTDLLLEHFSTQFSPEAFSKLFTTESGKHILVGTFVQRLLDTMEDQMAEEEGYDD